MRKTSIGLEMNINGRNCGRLEAACRHARSIAFSDQLAADFGHSVTRTWPLCLPGSMTVPVTTFGCQETVV